MKYTAKKLNANIGTINFDLWTYQVKSQNALPNFATNSNLALIQLLSSCHRLNYLPSL